MNGLLPGGHLIPYRRPTDSDMRIQLGRLLLFARHILSASEWRDWVQTQLRFAKGSALDYLRTFKSAMPDEYAELARRKIKSSQPRQKDPTPEEIRERCLEVQKTWSPHTRWKREHGILEEAEESVRVFSELTGEYVPRVQYEPLHWSIDDIANGRVDAEDV